MQSLKNFKGKEETSTLAYIDYIGIYTLSNFDISLAFTL